jgi:hypothetical protein
MTIQIPAYPGPSANFMISQGSWKEFKAKTEVKLTFQNLTPGALLNGFGLYRYRDGIIWVFFLVDSKKQEAFRDYLKSCNISLTPTQESDLYNSSSHHDLAKLIQIVATNNYFHKNSLQQLQALATYNRLS